MISRRGSLSTTLGAAGLLAAQAALDQGAWPERPVRIIVPISAGGASDVLTRMLAEQLHVKLGQTFIVENLTGAGGNIGMDTVAKAAPDGYTIASAPSAHSRSTSSSSHACPTTRSGTWRMSR
jgi:tripartite-type tricarboxylate transporter receptor subunit TctC